MKEEESQERESLLRELGISDDFLPDESAPPVDRALLVALAKQELPEAKAYEISRLIAAFRTWNDTFNEVMDVEFKSWMNSQSKKDIHAGSLEGSAVLTALTDKRLSAQAPSSEASQERLKPLSAGDEPQSTVAPQRGLETLLRRPSWQRYRLTMIALAAAVVAAVGIIFWSGNLRGRQFVVRLNDTDGAVSLDNHGNLSGLESVPQEWRKKAKETLLAEHVAIPRELAELSATRGGSVDDPSPVFITPVGTVVETDRPTFKWKPMQGTESYTVTVYSPTLPMPVSSGQLSEAEWTMDRPLQRGAVYSWEVTATKDGQQFVAPLPPASLPEFKILGETELEALQRARADVGDSHLLLGIVYAQAGLREAAEREFQALLDKNPQSSVAKKLLESVRLPDASPK